jgi:hypothetical protein
VCLKGREGGREEGREGREHCLCTSGLIFTYTYPSLPPFSASLRSYPTFADLLKDVHEYFAMVEEEKLHQEEGGLEYGKEERSIYYLLMYYRGREGEREGGTGGGGRERRGRRKKKQYNM